MMPISDFVRFMRHVSIGSEIGACWIWTGNKPDGRYGHFSVNGKTVKAHRWFYEFIHEPIPEELLVRHKCDNPQCVNPDHLETGTASQNTQDMHKRGRGADRRGIKHPLVKLTEADVREIRRLKACGHTETFLSMRYGVGRSQIGKIVHRINWKHIE
jgi:hypothetical protein